jgi:alginate O-acetyltransferase complex protein AlgI
MLFTSPVFFVFFAVYFCCHLAVPGRYRIYLIIGGSTIFYAWWKLEYVWLPYLLTAVAYGGVIWMQRAAAPAARKWRAALTIAVLFLPLAFFKYVNFFYAGLFGPFFGWSGRLVDLSLPLGVSFVTFTLTAFVVDIYRRRFALGAPGSTVLAYVLFFPHLIAGPILRPHELIPQLSRPRPATIRRIAVPVAIFTIGLVKKLVFADQIGIAVDAAYRAPDRIPSAYDALLAIYGFSVQIYCDFSGYTDMAIGLALLLGVRLPTNFWQPYTASSIVDFWRRWHITLSYWLRDYLYIPLGGNRNGRVQEARNILITMVLGGLWHGAHWTFILWGAVHGAGVVIGHYVHRTVRAPRWIGLLVTFHFVTLAWILFRAPDLGTAGAVVAKIFNGSWEGPTAVLSRNLFLVSLVAFFFATHRWDNHRYVAVVARRLRPELFWPMIGLLWAITIAVSQGNQAAFIYFEF